MREPVRLSADLALAIHEVLLRRFGGRAGIRDEGALESALARARNRWAYDRGDLAVLAAAHAYGIARSHPFVDGNKRMALLSLITFLGLNGVDFIADEAEAVVIMRDLAAGKVDEDGLTHWIRDKLPRKARSR